MKLKILFLLAVACIGINTSMHANDIDYVMQITLSDGTVDTYVVDERPRVSLDEKFVHVWTDEINTKYEVESVLSYTFVDLKTGIDEIKDESIDNEASGITFKYVDGENIIVRGLQSEDKLRVYTLSGKMVSVEIKNHEDHANISLRNQQSGTYIVSINNNKSIKVFKR